MFHEPHTRLLFSPHQQPCMRVTWTNLKEWTQETKEKKEREKTHARAELITNRSNHNSKLLSASHDSHPDWLIEAIARVMVEQVDAYAGAVLAAAGQDARPVHVHDAVHFEEVDGVRPGGHVRAGGGDGGRRGRRGAGRRHGSSCGGRGGRALRLGARRRRLLVVVVAGAGRPLRHLCKLVTASFSHLWRILLLLLLYQRFRRLS
uniref:Uncharacterized protein n=1 Tax=Arundo donax TaxID=35708 RepID=A0A0A9GFP2_ARUDO